MHLRIHNVTKTFNSRHRHTSALSNLGFQASQGEFVALVGPSGCGKSTLLRLLAGLLAPIYEQEGPHNAQVTV